MTELNREEQAKVDRLEELKRWRRTSEQYVNDAQIAAAEQLAQLAVANAEARARLQAQRQAEIDAKNAAHQQRMDAQAHAAQEAYLREARARYTGTEAQWQQDKDEILRQWRVRNALGGESLVERKRHQYGGML
jgi:hypothetical protein